MNVTYCRRRRRRRPGSQTMGLILLVMFAGLAVASSALASSPSAAGDTTFRVGWLLEPENLNPFVGLLGQDDEIWHLNYDLLVGFDVKTPSPRPEIATSWEVSPDGKTWTFKIRESVKWHDGVPLAAKDVAFTFNYIVDNNLLNLAIYSGGITGATAIDDTTVEITTVKPKSNMLATFVSIIPEHIWSKVGGKEASTTYANPMPIVGSGPFQVVEWRKGKFIRLKANQEYWGGAPKIDELFFENYQSADTMVADLKVGAIDAAAGLPQSQVPILKQTAGMTVLKGAFSCFNELGFNCDDSPHSQGNPMLRDAAFLHALNWAIDRQKIGGVWTADIAPRRSWAR